MPNQETATGSYEFRTSVTQDMGPTVPPSGIPDAPERIFNISIRQLDHGYIVDVGCKSFAIESTDRLAALLSKYLYNPAETQDSYLKGKLF